MFKLHNRVLVQLGIPFVRSLTNVHPCLIMVRSAAVCTWESSNVETMVISVVDSMVTDLISMAEA